jgi:hypothetical protein
MAMENIFGMMDPCMKVNGSRTKSMEEESTFGQMEENIAASGRITTCMEEESILGKTEECMKATMRMIENTDMEYIPGMMASSTRAIGKMESNMVKEYIEKMEKIAVVFGRTASALDGWMIKEVINIKMIMMLTKLIFEFFILKCSNFFKSGLLL